MGYYDDQGRYWEDPQSNPIGTILLGLLLGGGAGACILWNYIEENVPWLIYLFEGFLVLAHLAVLVWIVIRIVKHIRRNLQRCRRVIKNH